MNKRIYWNTNFIEFKADKTQSSSGQSLKKDDEAKADKTLNKLMHKLLNSESNSMYVTELDFERSLNQLKKQFYYIEAAGGFIEKNGQFLFIRRHNRWDLPKGKLEKGESNEEGAMRECEEECGIKNLEIIRTLPSTFHIYAYKDGYALKQSYWFYMTTDYAEKLVPQLEESITEVRWCSKKEVETEILNDTYFTITDVTHNALNIGK